jgi:ribosomal-protein-alanine N-acetyltransferase
MSDGMHLETSRLLLLAAGTSELTAELLSREALEHELGADVPEEWPPDLYDRQAIETTLAYLDEHPQSGGFTLWYLLLKPDGAEAPVLAGLCGFKSLPVAGSVEIGYSILGRFQRRGLMSEAVRALVDWAFSHPDVERLLAQTLPELVPSQRVLEKNGFRLVGPGFEEGAILYERWRA